MGSVNGDEVTSDLSSPGERIFVSVRVRPLNDKEVTRNEIVDWECINDNSVIYKNNDGPDRSMYPTSYTFDRVFGCHSSTRQVYEEGAKAVALSVVGGINSSIFAYGQTSSGKTYTMGGITEYTLADIFEYIRKHNERNFVLKFSALEIYNESVRDFLSSDPTPLRLLDDPERGTVVEKLTEEVVRDWNHLKLLLSICEAQRQVGETNLNESSSRSHQIIRLTIESTTKEMSGSLKSSILSATVNFVDLAGSERASQALSAGSRLKEGSHINRSLLTLGTVIRKLSKGRNGHVPYRDSKLTRILQSSLGGNARTAIICTMSPARSYVEQSRNTLLFATCAKEVTTHARVNLVISDKALVKQLQRELARLENELRNVGKYGSYETSILLRDKDLQIEKLERQVRELTMERDRALSRIHDLQQEDEAENNPTVWEASPLYSKFKVHAQSSWETQTSSTSTVADPQFSDAGSRTREFPQFTLRHCRSNSEANSLHSDIRLDLLPGIVTEPLSSDTSSDASPTPLSETHNLVISGNQDHVSMKSGDKVDGGAGEDFCRDVQCIESQESAVTSYGGISSSFYVKEPGEDLPTLLIPRSKEPIVEEPTSSSLTQDRELDRGRYHQGVALQISETSSSWQEVPDANNNDESLADTGTSEAAAVVNGVLPSVQTKKDEDDDDIKHEQNTQAGSGIDFTVKLQDIQRKLSELKGDGDSGKFSRKSSITSSHREAQATDANDVAERSTPSAEVKEVHEIYKEEVTDTLDEEEEEDVVQLKVEDPPKSVKDVGLDPQDDLDMTDGARCHHTNFKTIQQEVISLWDVCNVSLTYRTYFFLLYKNDPADSIYMEVELRRLRFIRDALSRGYETPLHGQTITPLSLSEKSLRRERQTLGKLLKKRISREDRESLFLRWGIRLESKRRCSQLVQRVWSSTEEMDHIAASSELVAKLVKFSDKQVRKELFGLNLMSIPKDSGRSSRSYSCRWNPMPHL